jgi:hypothetical protein
MRLSLSKRPILAGLVLAALAVTTVVVSGYTDKPDPAVPVAAPDQCAGCPRQGTDARCQSPCNACPLKGTDACCWKQCDNCPRQGTGDCCQAKAADPGTSNVAACPAFGTGGACAGKTAGCCGTKTQSDGSATTGSQSRAASPCGATGCPRAE